MDRYWQQTVSCCRSHQLHAVYVCWLGLRQPIPVYLKSGQVWSLRLELLARPPTLAPCASARLHQARETRHGLWGELSPPVIRVHRQHESSSWSRRTGGLTSPLCCRAIQVLASSYILISTSQAIVRSSILLSYISSVSSCYHFAFRQYVPCGFQSFSSSVLDLSPPLPTLDLLSPTHCILIRQIVHPQTL